MEKLSFFPPVTPTIDIQHGAYCNFYRHFDFRYFFCIIDQSAHYIMFNTHNTLYVHCDFI